ncbi:MAG: SagB family peptide dehydrogenase [Burkholderiaceae bacterium]|nr:SagB family peptide dehydrogenase [Burkholderiaceae bacterium]
MPKILWVALPLLLALALLVLHWLHGRAPARQAVNIWASLLLLGYLATTAGLGIYWVANQQLPVFDWHYLFGYATLLLVALHLVFNLPRVWRHFRRAERPVRPAPARPGWVSRRGLLGTIGLVAASGAAFLLGRQRGRQDAATALPAAAGIAAPAQMPLAAVERFHALSSHSRAGVLAGAPGVAWGPAPPPFKTYPVLPRQALPAPGTARDSRIGLAALADLLWHSVGVTAVRAGLHLRASPSSGALFSTELYVAARAVPGLAAGLWHYDARSHALDRLRALAPDDPAFDTPAGDAWRDAPALVVATAVFRRTGHKYRDRAYRYLLADLGHALENLQVAGAALGLHTRLFTAFDEAGLARSLGVDEAEEGVLALVGLRLGLPPEAPAIAAAPTWLPAPPLADTAAALGVTAAIHAATSLRATAAPVPASAVQPAAVAPPQSAIALPAVAALAPDWLRLIAARRSVRRYAATPLPLPTLSAVLARMTAAHGTRLSAALRIDLVALAVDGLAPGAYRHDPARQALLPRRIALPPAALRDAARAAALDQDVVGDAAVVFVLSADRATLAADPLGPGRGYRHALLEAGRLGERVYLEAQARGLGACGVGAFYDDEAAALVALDPARQWVLHFAALGLRG